MYVFAYVDAEWFGSLVHLLTAALFQSMNYLRGAVNAISAPYQYYKELPPINPSTLTGAIDVIVIQRPGPAGDTELACSPFHVRFGKWQVLRPSDRKVSRLVCFSPQCWVDCVSQQVDVSVNGQPIPYHMKIGEAGEAFFVFETDEDVPPDLITSPILQPTRPEEEASDAQLDAPDAHLGVPDHRPSDANVSEEVPKTFQVESKQEVHDEYQEPEFLDLNASSSSSQLPEQVEDFYDVNTTPAQRFHQPSFLRHSASQSSIQRQSVSYKPSRCSFLTRIIR
jgi:phosphatidate phosphatase LPIN